MLNGSCLNLTKIYYLHRVKEEDEFHLVIFLYEFK